MEKEETTPPTQPTQPTQKHQRPRVIPLTTIQWVEPSVFDAFCRCAKLRPDYDVTMTEKAKDESGFILCALTFSNVGKTVFTRRLITFVVSAMRDFHEKA